LSRWESGSLSQLEAAERSRRLAPMRGAAPWRDTVKLALDDYFAARESRGSKGVRADRYAAEAALPS
jgi:hypothetical protein